MHVQVNELECALTSRSWRVAAFACAVSVGLHSLALAAVWWTGWLDLFLPEVHARLAGSQRVIYVASAWSTPAPEQEATEVEVVAAPVEVTPQETVIARQRFVEQSADPPPELARVIESTEITPAELARELEAKMTELPSPEKQTLPRSHASLASQASAAQTPGNDATLPPRPLLNRPPRYPDAARVRGWQGTVLLRLAINDSGAVTEVAVERSSGYPLLDGEAANAVRSWRFEPARRRGEPVATVELLPVRFRL